MIRLRRRRLPEEVAAALTLDPGERVVAWAATDTGHLVATDRALWDVTGGAAASRLFWDEIDKATWRDNRLVVTETGRRRQRAWTVTDRGQLPEAVRERVTASILVSTAGRLPTGGGVRIVCRRRVGQPDLRWMVHFDRPDDADDPVARAAAERMLLEARNALQAERE